MDKSVKEYLASWPLAEARTAYKTQADTKRVELKPFHSGDRVYLFTRFLQSLQPSKKLRLKFVGPFPMKQIINSVTVELELPKSLRKVHPVFHCSLLKSEVILPLRPIPLPIPEPLMVKREQHFEIKETLDLHMHRVEGHAIGSSVEKPPWSSE